MYNLNGYSSSFNKKFLVLRVGVVVWFLLKKTLKVWQNKSSLTATVQNKLLGSLKNEIVRRSSEFQSFPVAYYHLTKNSSIYKISCKQHVCQLLPWSNQQLSEQTDQFFQAVSKICELNCQGVILNRRNVVKITQFFLFLNFSLSSSSGRM